MVSPYLLGAVQGLEQAMAKRELQRKADIKEQRDTEIFDMKKEKFQMEKNRLEQKAQRRKNFMSAMSRIAENQKNIARGMPDARSRYADEMKKGIASIQGSQEADQNIIRRQMDFIGGDLPVDSMKFPARQIVDEDTGDLIKKEPEITFPGKMMQKLSPEHQGELDAAYYKFLTKPGEELKEKKQREILYPAKLKEMEARRNVETLRKEALSYADPEIAMKQMAKHLAPPKALSAGALKILQRQQAVKSMTFPMGEVGKNIRNSFLNNTLKQAPLAGKPDWMAIYDEKGLWPGQALINPKGQAFYNGKPVGFYGTNVNLAEAVQELPNVITKKSPIWDIWNKEDEKLERINLAKRTVQAHKTFTQQSVGIASNISSWLKRTGSQFISTEFTKNTTEMENYRSETANIMSEFKRIFRKSHGISSRLKSEETELEKIVQSPGLWMTSDEARLGGLASMQRTLEGIYNKEIRLANDPSVPNSKDHKERALQAFNLLKRLGNVDAEYDQFKKNEKIQRKMESDSSQGVACGFKSGTGESYKEGSQVIRGNDVLVCTRIKAEGKNKEYSGWMKTDTLSEKELATYNKNKQKSTQTKVDIKEQRDTDKQIKKQMKVPAGTSFQKRAELASEHRKKKPPLYGAYMGKFKKKGLTGRIEEYVPKTEEEKKAIFNKWRAKFPKFVINENEYWERINRLEKKEVNRRFDFKTAKRKRMLRSKWKSKRSKLGYRPFNLEEAEKMEGNQTWP